MSTEFSKRLKQLEHSHKHLIERPNKKQEVGNGIFDRYEHPVLTSAQTPHKRQNNQNPQTNPYLMERFGINAAFNAGAIKWRNKYLLVARVEGLDRKSFFAVAECPNGLYNFTFW